MNTDSTNFNDLKRVWPVLGALLLGICATLPMPTPAAETVVWSEDFEVEGLPIGWFTPGCWETGQPTNPNGPGAAFEGLYCAAVGLKADYANNSSCTLLSPSVIVPPASQNPRLRFWQWFSINASGYCNQPGDYARVYVRRTNGVEEIISPDYYWSSDWSRASLDLSEYAGEAVQFRFSFYGNCTGNAPGWFIDMVQVVTGDYALGNSGNFEAGLGDWAASRGNWQVGLPLSGPSTNALGWRAHEGTNCAGVVLDGSYLDYTSSSLVSPWTVVPSASQNPRLRFWQWFSINASGYCNQRGDYAQVYVRRTNGVEEIISPEYYWSSDWTRASLDLSDYAGQPVQFEFYFYGNCTGGGAGWFIDEVQVVTNAYQLANPEGFENGLGDWAASRGNWQVGQPTDGPGRAHTGNQCAGVVLDGSYLDYTSSSLVSPWFTVPSSNQTPRIKFWHWYSINANGYCNQAGDYGRLYVRKADGTEEPISPAYANSSDWVQASIDLTQYGGQRVQFEFYIYANCTGGGAGWFIDDLCIEAGTMQFNVIGSRVINEDTTLSFNVSVRGTNSSSCVRFSLGPGAPTGATLDPVTGVFNWTPTEIQGPFPYWIPIFASDACASNALSCTYPQVQVNEVNLAPLLTEPNRTIGEAQSASWNLCGTDMDIPANSLTYMKLSGVTNFTVNAAGRVTWSPAQLGTYAVTVKVTDNNPPAVNTKQLSTTNTFTITVVSTNTLYPYSLMMRHVSFGSLEFTIMDGRVGSNYVLQCATALLDCPPTNHWQDVMPPIQATTIPFTFGYTVPDFIISTNRFYRLRTQ